MSDALFAQSAQAFVAACDAARADGAGGSEIENGLRDAMTAAIRLYAVRADTDAPSPPPIDATAVTPTDVVLAVSAMLRAVNLNLFDIAMWYNRGNRA